MTDHFSRHKITPGWIEVICGCMFSGKTSELIKQVHRAELARLNCIVFKPKIDNRYSETEVASHDQNTFPSVIVESSDDIIPHIDRNTDVVGIDEAQFFDDRIVDIVTLLADSGKRVVLAGLDTDWQGKPFGPMPTLLAIADVIHKQYAICMVCGDPATRTQRLVAQNDSILVGSSESYEARCRNHFDPLLSVRLTQVAAPQDEMGTKSITEPTVQA
ncbi:MAG: thymidine kinase [Bdellovibrionaceae bacterium]|nr:thymidine kinase [Pseudobdellovibrionaceae bacterium]|tara:strand:- start:130516 stop:131166 length:651 start_codon:yes stop_codon:yes gene_type:complete